MLTMQPTSPQLLLLCLATFASSTTFDWAALARDIERRQTFVGTGVTPSSTPTSVTTPSSDESTSTEQVPTSSPPSDTSSGIPSFPSSSETSTETFQQTSTTPPFTSSEISSTSTPDLSSTPDSTTSPSSTPVDSTSFSPSSTVESSSATPSSSSTSFSLASEVVTTSPLVSTETQAVLTTFLTINASGQPVTSVLTSATPVQHTTGFATITSEASLNTGNNGGSSGSGLSDSSKRVIGGVVGGVGGAIVLGAVAFVAWRLWGKKRGQPIDNDYQFSPSGPAHAPSASMGTENTFGSNGTTGLEKYDQPHRPAASPNATTTATNF